MSVPAKVQGKRQRTHTHLSRRGIHLRKIGYALINSHGSPPCNTHAKNLGKNTRQSLSKQY